MEVFIMTTPTEQFVADSVNVLNAHGATRLDTELDSPFVVVREVAVHYHGRGLKASAHIRTPEHAAALARRCVRSNAKENYLACYLEGRHRHIARTTVSIGTATASLVHPREVFQPAVGVGAVGLLILHNHPSGDPTPSAEDREVTSRLIDAGKLLGIEMLDHVIWTETDFYSFKASGDIS